ncbi:RING zinc finger-containing protein [Tieghemostelium lacteum]|uniref:Vacuolar protein sorting-associated protein 11 homolog n=1 Tax=Tieghemostelium lacteum TaxID=361077 RepID=A0A152A377_TIELA|nr:RING zinc finger-containing protein [Tieghemostelium lacteum]|eukprot:KYR00557.1 RING zinc finger-containing protein [Tieghemostelium lacteum]
MNNWKRFTFFDKEIVKESVKDKDEPSIQKLSITCTTSGRGRLIIGDQEGFIYFVDREFRNTSFQAYQQNVLLLHQLKERNFLCSVGYDDKSYGQASVLKVWNLDKTDKNDNPLCVRAIKLEKAISVTCIAVLEDLSQIMVGLSDGEIIAIRGDIFRDKTIKQKSIRQPDSPITGMGFMNTKGPSQTGPVLFAVTTTNVLTYYTAPQFKDQESVIDDEGGDFGSFIMSDDGSPIIARTDAIYFYNIDGRGPCFGFQGIKTKVLWFRSYLVVVGLENSQANNALFPGQSFGSPSQQNQINKNNNILNIYDVKNKYIGFTDKFDSISHIASEWGSIFLFSADGKIYQLEEKDTQTKLETLFKKHSYLVAIDLAKSQHYDNSSIADVYRKYGDHLYTKGDYDGAITQYLCTIGQLEPSYVIRKFLDAQRIHNLTSYIQALHEKNLANANHTTLLLNCYTKLKDVKKLDHFIKTDSGTFDVETAIKVCRQAGYYEHALFLASKNNRHEWYLKILLEDLSEHRKALHYIQTLEFEEADKNLKKYGKTLVSELPDETTRVLMKLCTDYQPIPTNDLFGRPMTDTLSTVSSTVGLGTKLKAAPEEFIHIFVSQTEWLVKFLEYMIQQNNDSPMVYNTMLELYLREDQQRGSGSDKKEKAYEFLTNPKAKFDQDHAMILAQVHNWKQGILYLYEKLELFNEIIEYHMENNDYEGLIRACKKYGVKDPNLWVRALSYFSITKQDCKNEIVEVLANIDRDNLIPPLLVIQILSQNKNTTLEVIKEYITRRLSQETLQIDKDYSQIKQFADETEKMRNEITDLRSNAKIFQQSKCNFCQSPLDLPSIHFLCSHSFHQRCLSENERECTICGPNNRRFLEIKKNQSDSAIQHDQFFKSLRTSPDGFTTVSEYFGKGILS